MAKCIAVSSLNTAPDTYLYSLAHIHDIFATIGSDDSLRLFDASLNLLSKAVPAHSGISCLTASGNGFVTGGRDGNVRVWDARASRAGIEVTEPKGNGYSSLACHEQFIAAGTESTKEGLGDVDVYLYDVRKPSTPLRKYAESHTDTITQLAFHLNQPKLLLSGSTDGLVSVFDIEQEDEEDALQQVFNPRAAVHRTGFLTATEVYIVTSDEQFSVHVLGDASDSTARSYFNYGDVRARLDCTYVVSVVNAPQPAIVYGHTNRQTLGIVQLDPLRYNGFGQAINLPGAHGDEIVRDLIALGTTNKAVSCGEDGQVKMWDFAVTG